MTDSQTHATTEQEEETAAPPQQYLVYRLKEADDGACLQLPPVAFKSLLTSTLAIPEAQEKIQQVLTLFSTDARDGKLPPTIPCDPAQMKLLNTLVTMTFLGKPISRRGINRQCLNKVVSVWVTEHLPDLEVWWQGCLSYVLFRMDLDVRYQMFKAMDLQQFCLDFPPDSPMPSQLDNPCDILYTERSSESSPTPPPDASSSEGPCDS